MCVSPKSCDYQQEHLEDLPSHRLHQADHVLQYGQEDPERQICFREWTE